MASSSSGSGSDFLARKSNANRVRSALPELHDIVVVDDESIDAQRLFATLRIMFGYDIGVRLAATAQGAVERVRDRTPDILFLDDILKPSDDAARTIPSLRHAGYVGPIVVISGHVTRTRRSTLLAAGANAVIHKDEVDSVHLAETLQRIFCLKTGD